MAFVHTLLYTGLRRGEILTLTKNDIDLKAGTITVNKVLIFKGNQPEIKNCPKSDAGFRTTPLPDNLKLILTEYFKTLNTLILFPSARNELMAFRRSWDNVIEAINIAAGGRNDKPKIQAIADDITPHIFRHSYATMLYYAA